MSACPKCQKFGSAITETRQLRNGWVRRRRLCNNARCCHKWMTYEMPADQVDTEEFDKEALMYERKR